MNSEILIQFLSEYWVKGSVILLIGLISVWAARKQSAEFRHFLWMRIFGLVLTIPLLLLLPRWEVIPLFLQAGEVNQPAFTSTASSLELIKVEGHIPIEPRGIPTPFHIPWKSGIILIWAFGTALFLLRFGVAQCMIGRFRKKSHSVPQSIKALVSQIKDETGFTRDIEIVRFTPLAWMASSRIASLHEEICDRRVLASGCAPNDYATLLFHQAQAKTPYPFSATAMAKQGTLETRIKMILHTNPNQLSISHSSPTTRKRNLTAIAVLIPGLALALLGISETARAENTERANPGSAPTGPDSSKLESKLKRITLSGIQFNNTPLSDAIEFLTLKSVALDTEEPDPPKKGVNFIIKGNADFRKTPISLTLRNIPLADAVRYISELSGGQFRVDQHAVMVSPGGKKAAVQVINGIPDGHADTKLKLERIVIPKLHFTNTPLKDAINFIRMKSIELDSEETDPAKKGINIILSKNVAEAKINLRLDNIPLGEAIKYTSDIAKSELRIENNTIVFTNPEQ